MKDAKFVFALFSVIFANSAAGSWFSKSTHGEPIQMLPLENEFPRTHLNLLPSQTKELYAEVRAFAFASIVAVDEQSGQFECRQIAHELDLTSQRLAQLAAEQGSDRWAEQLDVRILLSLLVRLAAIWGGQDAAENDNDLLREFIAAYECVRNAAESGDGDRIFSGRIEPILDVDVETGAQRFLGFSIDFGLESEESKENFQLLLEVSGLRQSPGHIFAAIDQFGADGEEGSGEAPELGRRLFSRWKRQGRAPLQFHSEGPETERQYPFEKCQVLAFGGAILKKLLRMGERRDYFEGTILHELHSKIEEKVEAFEEVTRGRYRICTEWNTNPQLKMDLVDAGAFVRFENALQIWWDPWPDVRAEVRRRMGELPRLERACDILPKFTELAETVPLKMVADLRPIFLQLKKSTQNFIAKIESELKKKRDDKTFAYMKRVNESCLKHFLKQTFRSRKYRSRQREKLDALEKEVGKYRDMHSKTQQLSSAVSGSFSSIERLLGEMPADVAEELRVREFDELMRKTIQQELPRVLANWNASSPSDDEPETFASLEPDSPPSSPGPTLERQIQVIQDIVEKLPQDGPLHNCICNEQKLRFYALYKQATVGDVNTARPSVFNIIERKKWDAWKSVEGMDAEETKRQCLQAFLEMFDVAARQGDIHRWLASVDPGIAGNLALLGRGGA